MVGGRSRGSNSRPFPLHRTQRITGSDVPTHGHHTRGAHMAQVTGSQLVAEQLRREGVDTLFYW